MSMIGHLINGELRTDAERTQDVFNPATGEVSKQVAIASVATVEEAIAAAQAVYPAWRDTPPAKRARANTRKTSVLRSTPGASSNHWASLPESPRLTSLPWCRSGCTRWRSSAVILLY